MKTFSYISQLKKFVETINTRFKRVFKIASTEMPKKDVSYLLSIIELPLHNLVAQPEF